MKKALFLTILLSTTIFLNSCEKSEQEKIMDDLDLQINEAFEQVNDEDFNNIWDEKDEVEEIKNTEKQDEKIEQVKKIEIKNDTKKEVQIVKSVNGFAKCLTENWAKLYWTLWCWHCKTQKEMFWDAIKNINFIDCDKERKICKDAWITDYPTWVIWWKKYPWTQSFEKLWELTWCKLEK